MFQRSKQARQCNTITFACFEVFNFHRNNHKNTDRLTVLQDGLYTNIMINFSSTKFFADKIPIYITCLFISNHSFCLYRQGQIEPLHFCFGKTISTVVFPSVSIYCLYFSFTGRKTSLPLNRYKNAAICSLLPIF